MSAQGHLREGVRVLRSDGLPGVTIHRGTAIRDAFTPHFHVEAHISVVLDGGRVQTLGRRRHQLGPSDLSVIPPGEVHSGASREAGGWSFIAVYCGAEALARAVDSLADEPGLRTRELPAGVGRDPTGAVPALLGALSESPLAAQTSWLSLIARLLRGGDDAPAGRREREVVRRARAYLDDHLGGAPSLDELAAVAGVSKEYLVRSFTADLGLPPHAYHVNARIERARRMLLRGDPITEVALSLGFHDQSHFSRHFRRIVGVPPGRLARAHRERGGDPGQARTRSPRPLALQREHGRG